MLPESLNVFDFDGTLVKVNSFRVITKRFSAMLIKKFKIGSFLTLITWYILRRIGIISHLKFKQRVVDIFEKSLTEEEKRSICQKMFDDNVNEAVFERLVNFDNCIICTASPFSYVSRVSFNKDVTIISSLDTENHLPDIANSGPAKVENLKAYFKGKDIHVANFFTDNSIDDQAIIDLSAKAFVVEGDRVRKVK